MIETHQQVWHVDDEWGDDAEDDPWAVPEPVKPIEQMTIGELFTAAALSRIDWWTPRAALRLLGIEDPPHALPDWLLTEAWLWAVLKFLGPQYVNDLEYYAEGQGFGTNDLREAKRKLRLLSIKDRGVTHGSWRWMLPPLLANGGRLSQVHRRWRYWEPQGG